MSIPTPPLPPEAVMAKIKSRQTCHNSFLALHFHNEIEEKLPHKPIETLESTIQNLAVYINLAQHEAS